MNFVCVALAVKLWNGKHLITYATKHDHIRVTVIVSLSVNFATCTIYKLGYIKGGSTTFKVQKDGCGIPSAARALLGPEGL